MKNSTTKLRKIVVVFIWITIWQVIAYLVGQEILIVSPVRVAWRIFELGIKPDFWIKVAISCWWILYGFTMAVVVAIVLAVLTSMSVWIQEFISVLMTVIKATPVASFIILALVWMKSDRLSSFTAFLMVLPIVWSNVSQGILQTDKSLLQMASVYQFSMYKKVRYVYIPHIKPYFHSSILTGIGLAWKAGIAAEVLALPRNTIGTELYNSKIYLETVDLFAWTVVIISLSMLIEGVFVRLTKKNEDK